MRSQPALLVLRADSQQGLRQQGVRRRRVQRGMLPEDQILLQVRCRSSDFNFTFENAQINANDSLNNNKKQTRAKLVSSKYYRLSFGPCSA